MSVRRASGQVHISTLVTTFRAVMRPTAADDAIWHQESGPAKHLSHGQGHLARDWYKIILDDSFSAPTWLGTHHGLPDSRSGSTRAGCSSARTSPPMPTTYRS